MPHTPSISTKAAPLLPHDRQHNRPLRVVLTIMAFLTAIACVLTAMSFRSVAVWKTRITQSATVQIMDVAPADREMMTSQALKLLETEPDISQINVMSQPQSKALLRPWLGDVDLPPDLPLPILITVDIQEGQTLDTGELAARLEADGIKARVLDNRHYSRQIRKTARTIQATMLLILGLVLASAIGISMYATQSALITHKKIITVLTQIGATHLYIIRLISGRFFTHGLIAGAAGTGLAVILTFIFSILTFSAESASIFGQFRLTETDVLRFLVLPVVFALFCAATAAITCRSILEK